GRVGVARRCSPQGGVELRAQLGLLGTQGRDLLGKAVADVLLQWPGPEDDPDRERHEDRDDGHQVVTKVDHVNNPTIQDHTPSHRAAASWSRAVPAGVEAKATNSANRATNSMTARDRLEIRER